MSRKNHVVKNVQGSSCCAVGCVAIGQKV